MSRRTTQLLKAGLATLYYTGGHRLLAPLTRGVGAIFLLHQVAPGVGADPEQSQYLGVTPAHLEELILAVKDAGFDIVSLDELHWRLTEGAFDRPFAAFTFDCGYRSTLEHAYPVFRGHDLPFTVFVPGTFPDGRADLWWLALERVVATVDSISLKIDGELRQLRSATPEEKTEAFSRIQRWLLGIEEGEARSVVRELCRGIGYDPADLSSLTMSWKELKRLAQDPRVTIGASSSRYTALAGLSEGQARAEIEASLARLERELGRRPGHLAYPHGTAGSAGPREFRIARELGFKTAMTARRGLIYAEHATRLTALPRIPLDSGLQDPRYLKVLLSGAPFVIGNGGRRVLAA